MRIKQNVNKDVIDELYEEGYLYAAFGEYWRRTRGYKMFKIPVDADFLCPNWDGRLSNRGCTYCPGLGKEVGRPTFFEVQGKSVRAQLDHQIEYHRGKGVAEKFMAYFYPATNTYRRVTELEKLFEEAISHPDVIGLSIGTRPDCVPDEILDVLEGYTKRGYEVWIELGQQTYHYHTIEKINRRHGIAECIDATGRIKEHGIFVCDHIILGLPYETPGEMIETARILSVVGVDAVKIYPLLVMKGTRIAGEFYAGKYRPIAFTEYINLVCDFLENLSPYVLIQRLSKDCGLQLKLAPEWNTFRLNVSSRIEKELKRRGTKQGVRYKMGLGEVELFPLNGGIKPVPAINASVSCNF